MLRVVAFDMTPQNRSSLRHPGSAPAAPPPRSRHPWLRSSVGASSASRRTQRPQHFVGWTRPMVPWRGLRRERHWQDVM